MQARTKMNSPGAIDCAELFPRAGVRKVPGFPGVFRASSKVKILVNLFWAEGGGADPPKTSSAKLVVISGCARTIVVDFMD